MEEKQEAAMAAVEYCAYRPSLPIPVPEVEKMKLLKSLTPSSYLTMDPLQ